MCMRVELSLPLLAPVGGETWQQAGEMPAALLCSEGRKFGSMVTPSR